MDLGVKSTPFTSSNASWKSGTDAVPGQFPAGLKVLVVDDDPTCLRILEKMLKNCLYEVTTCNRAEVALNFLRNNKNGCNVVISDVHMPDMDGFKLLEHVGLEMDLPVIMMSADDSKHVVMKGITHGACDYLIKPVRIEALKNIWQHVVRKKKHEWSEKDLEHLGSVEEGERQQKLQEDFDCSSSVNEGNWKQSKKRKEEEDEAEDRDDTSALKKPRVVWSVELHQQFVAAVNQLGIDKAVPKKILESMNIPGLTRENVASHLQKYRLYLRRLSGVSQHHYGLGSSFMGPTDVQFGPMSSLNGVDLQALAASGQIPHQSLASIQAAALGRATSKSAVPLPLVDQRNIFNFENPKMRFVEGQNESSKQVNLLHGFPTNMDSKQLASLHQSALGNMNMHVHSQTSQSGSMLMQMAQLKPQSSTQILNDINGSRNAIENENGCGQQYNSIPKQSNSANLSSDSTSFSGNITFPPSSNSRVSSAEMKGSRGFLPNYDVLNNVNQNRNHEWHLQNVGSRSGPPRHLNIQGEPSANKAALSPAGGHGNPPNIAHFPATDKSLRSKAERLPGMGFQNGLLHERFGQEDLMSALLKQQQDGVVVPVETETEFGFDGY